MLNNEIKIIAFDCFDTIVHRDCNPDTILYMWAREMCAKIKFIITPKNLYNIRKKCERELKNSLKVEEVSYKDLIKGVYDYLKYKNYKVIDINFEDFLNISYFIETKIEMEHIFIDEECIKLVKLYKEEGKKIIIISDFYLGKSFFEILFKKLNIFNLFDHIYISSEIGKRKSSGSLYEHIISEFKIKSKEILMIGDNKKSDIKIPRKMGILTNHRPYIEKHNIILEKNLKKYIKNVSYKINENNIFNGYIPILLLFIGRLYEALIKDNCKNVLFCSREGQKLKILFDEYQKKLFGETKIKSHYFYVSRRSTLLPSLDDISIESFSRIFRQYKVLKLYDFLSSIGFNEEEIIEIKKNINIDLERNVGSPENDKFLKELILNDNFINIYNKKRKNQKKLFKKYINQFNINTENESIYMVDIGWKGTIQDNLFNIFDKNVNINGYYLGLFKHDHSEKNLKNGLIFSTEFKTKNYDALSYNYVEFERIFVADHGPTLEYMLDFSGEVIPYLSKNIQDIKIYEYVKDWQANMINDFVNILNIMRYSTILPSDIEDFLVKSHIRQLTINIPKQNSIYMKFRTKYKENFGDISGIAKKNKRKIKKEHLERGKFLFVDYSYRILDIYNLKMFYPIANIYCRLVYIVKSMSLK